LKVIIISDRDGVPLLRLSKDNKFPELGTKQSFLATFAVANEQASKIDKRIGLNQSIICIYKSSVVSCHPITFISS
jgi:hypothetical protein